MDVVQNGHLLFTTNVQISSRESPVTSFTCFRLYPFKDMISRTRNMLMVLTEQHAHDSLLWSLRVQPNLHQSHQINIACTRSLFATCQLLNLPQFSDVLKMTEGFNPRPDTKSGIAMSSRHIYIFYNGRRSQQCVEKWINYCYENYHNF